MEIFTLASSSSGNCTVVSHNGSLILIDAGISLRRIRLGLQSAGLTPDDLTGVLVTHEHIDHISGIKMLVKYHKIPVFTSSGTACGICRWAPEAEPFMNCVGPGVEFSLGDIAVKSFKTPHDAYESVGYRLEAGGKKLAYITDLGCVTDDIIDAACGADVAVIEANHDVAMLKTGPYPYHLKQRILSGHGHLSNPDSAGFAVRLAASGTRHLLLAHLSRENNTPRLARDTVESSLSEAGITVGGDVELDVAPPDTMGRKYII